MKPIISGLMTGGTIAALCHATLATAQTAPAELEAAAAGAAEIVVTAQGRTQRLQDVPISASVVSGAQLEAANLRNLQDVTERMPAVKLTPGPASDLINIRGVGSGLNSGFEQSVATFVDGVYRGRSRSSRAALFDIERVEVLKGPQTTFFGNNAIAGALNIATRRARPGQGLEYSGSALYSPSDGEFALEGGISASVSDDLAVRVAAKYFGMNGYVENDRLSEDGPRQRDFVARGSVAWQPTDMLRTDLRIDYGRFRDNNFFPAEVVGCPAPAPYPSPRGMCAAYLAAEGPNADGKLDYRASGGDSRFALDYVEAALTNTLSIGGHRLKSITSYYDHDVESLVQLAPFPLSGIGGRATRFPNSAPESYHSFSQELRLESPAGRPLEYMVGAYYAEGRLSTTTATGFYFLPAGSFAPGFTTAATPIAAIGTLRQRDRTLSAFAAATLHLSSRLRLNGGLRYSVVRKTASRNNRLGIGQDDPNEDFVPLPEAAQVPIRAFLGGQAGNFLQPRRTDRKLMPSISAQFDVTPNVMTYASYTKGFKAGGYALGANRDMFEPETVDAYELGIKGSAFDKRLTFALAGFYSTYDSLQESTNVVLENGLIQTVVGNVAKARAKGVEVSATGYVTEGLTLNANVGYLDARYVDYPGAPCTIAQTLASAICSQDLSGARRAYSPEWSGSVGFSARIPVGAMELRIDPNVTVTSRYFQQASADPLTEQEAFEKIDLRLGFGPRDRRWEVALIGKNLTDVATGSFRNNIPTTPGTIYVLPDRPRSIAIQFMFRN